MRHCFLLLFAVSVSPLMAGIELTENIGDGTETEWPGTPVLTVLENPSQAGARLAVSEKSPIVSQTFVPFKNFTLHSLMIRYSVAENGGSFVLRIQEVGEELEDGTYAEGKNLFPTELDFSITTLTENEARLMEIKLTGESRIQLKEGVKYALELVCMNNPALSWGRRASDEYKEGMAHVNRTPFPAGEETRDLALALYGE